MRKIFIVALLLLTSGVFGQTLLTGQVKDNKNNPVTGASLTVKDSYDGGTTDSLGRFSFRTDEKGEKILLVSAVGFKPFEQTITLAGTDQTLSIQLREEMNELKAVVITAGSFEAGDKKRGTVLTTLDILTTASANADITGAIRTLPGTQQVGESEGLFVRGGTASETRTYIDGTLVNNFFYSSVPNIAQRGRFSPALFKGTVFSAGGYSALYGQALSSALILESVDLPDQSQGNFGLSPLGINGGYQKLSRDKRSSWGVSYGYTNLKIVFEIIKQRPEYTRVPTFHTGDANFRIKTSRTGILKYYGYFSQNKLGIRNPSIDTLGYKDAFRLDNFNMYHNLAWRENLGAFWKVNIGASFSNNSDNIDGNLQGADGKDAILSGLEYKNFGLESRGRYINGKAVFERRLRGLSAIRFGGEFNHSNDRADYTLYNGDEYPNDVKENLLAGFAEADIYLTNALAAKLGSRVEHSQLLGRTNIAPRASLAYKVGKESQASLAYGIFYQNPERRYLPSAANLDFMKATHYIAQFQKTSSLQTIRAEVFYKKYDNLLKTVIVNNQEQGSTNAGSGYAQGFELFYRDKRTIKNFDYWISYSYLDTKRDFLNYPSRLQPGFAAKHTANLVVKRFVTGLKTQFNANYVYATGRPYYNIRYDNASSKFDIYDQGKTIPYHSLSLSVNYLPNVFKQGSSKFTVLVLSVNNVLNSKQIFGYNYSYNGVRKEAVMPASRSFVYLGLFISFGVDRTDDVINSNL